MEVKGVRESSGVVLVKYNEPAASRLHLCEH